MLAAKSLGLTGRRISQEASSNVADEQLCWQREKLHLQQKHAAQQHEQQAKHEYNMKMDGDADVRKHKVWAWTGGLVAVAITNRVCNHLELIKMVESRRGGA